jgi:hypothetical protein
MLDYIMLSQFHNSIRSDRMFRCQLCGRSSLLSNYGSMRSSCALCANWNESTEKKNGCFIGIKIFFAGFFLRLFRRVKAIRCFKQQINAATQGAEK